MFKNKLLKLNKMDGTFNYKRPCRDLSVKEKAWIRKYVEQEVHEPIDSLDPEYNPGFSNSAKEIEDYNSEQLLLKIVNMENTLTFLNKTSYQECMKNICKKIDEYFLPYVWITISPKKFENKLANFRIMYLLDKTLREYFYQCYRKCDEIHWCLEFGPNGDHAHAHILCRPIEAQQKSFVKNFSRDFITLWKKGQDKESKYIDILDLKKIAFKLNTLRRPEFIDDKLKYMNNDTKDAIHENPRDAELFAEMKHPVIKKYENC